RTLGAYARRLYEYGYAPSPAIYQNRLIVSAEYELGGLIVAVDRKTGEEVWRHPRPNNLSFTSPIIANTGGRDQLLMSGAQQIVSINPQDGQLLWTTNATTAATCGTMVWDNERVFASGGYPKPGTFCVAADGSGTVVWSNPQKCYEQSMLCVGGYIYAVTDGGVAYCWRATDGQEMWKERLAGPISSSPTLAGDVVHLFTEAGEHFAFRAIPEKCELLAREQVATDVFASPAIVGSVMYLRVGNQEANGNRQEYLAALT
ncbi:MAG: PQQ-binding-like beta-propeller repeat protein, partial [Planctomycetaceae bacterium]|nr:PQQ-binding-like beta-propeller repeat protein [Planctomycetaceae bacterium]